MVSVDDLNVQYLGRYGESESLLFLSDNGFLAIYVPESAGFVLYSDNRLMQVDDFVIGSKHIDQWSFCCKCGEDSGNFYEMEVIGLVHENIPDGVDLAPRSLRKDLHKSLSNTDGADLSNAWICKDCRSNLFGLFDEAVEDHKDKIASLII